MNVFGIGLPEMLVILVLALLVFGPKKLPEIGRSLGKAIRGFQDASKEFEEEFKRESKRAEQEQKSKPPEALAPQKEAVADMPKIQVVNPAPVSAEETQANS